MNGVSEKKKGSSPKRNRVAADTPSQMSESEELLLKKKIQVKSQALLILSQELDQCRVQRDRYKLMAEELQEDLDRRKKAEDKKVVNGYKLIPQFSKIREINKTNTLEEDTKLMDLLVEAKEQNKCLRLQVDFLRHKLKEAQDDIKALRTSKSKENLPVVESTSAIHQREELIEELERLNVKYLQMKLDLKLLLDEKQEIAVERDAFKSKAHRLNHELSNALSAAAPIDIDALINENRYLQERIQQLVEDKELVQQSVLKYKTMLENKRQKGILKLGTKLSMGSVMNFKQLEQLLNQGPNLPPQKSAAALTELHSICTALLDSLNDKTLALVHQKKANKILALRMCELEGSIESPTMKLLEGYSSSEVDVRCDSTSVTSDLSEDKESELQFDESFNGQDVSGKSGGKGATSRSSGESITMQSIDATNQQKTVINQTIESENTSSDESNLVATNQITSLDNELFVEEVFNSQLVDDFLENLKEDENCKNKVLTPFDIEEIDKFIDTGNINHGFPASDVNIVNKPLEKTSNESAVSKADDCAVPGASTSATVARSNLFKKIETILTEDSYNFEKLLLKSLPQDLVECVQKNLKEIEQSE